MSYLQKPFLPFCCSGSSQGNPTIPNNCCKSPVLSLIQPWLQQPGITRQYLSWKTCNSNSPILLHMLPPFVQERFSSQLSMALSLPGFTRAEIISDSKGVISKSFSSLCCNSGEKLTWLLDTVQLLQGSPGPSGVLWEELAVPSAQHPPSNALPKTQPALGGVVSGSLRGALSHS